MDKILKMLYEVLSGNSALLTAIGGVNRLRRYSQLVKTVFSDTYPEALFFDYQTYNNKTIYAPLEETYLRIAAYSKSSDIKVLQILDLVKTAINDVDLSNDDVHCRVCYWDNNSLVLFDDKLQTFFVTSRYRLISSFK